VGFLRRLPSGEVLDQVPLDLPEQTLRTRAVWYTLSQEVLARYGFAAGSARSRDAERRAESGTTNGGNGNRGNENGSKRDGDHAGKQSPAEAAGPGVSNPARLPGALHAA